MRKTTVYLNWLIIDKNMLEAISRVFKGIERDDKYRTTYSFETKKNVEFSTEDFIEFSQECLMERNIAAIDFTLYDHMDIDSTRYFKVKFNSSSSILENGSFYYASCKDRNISDSFIMQIKDKLDNCEKYSLLVRSILSKYFTIPLISLTTYSIFSSLNNTSDISKIYRYFILTLSVLFLLRMAMPFAYPNCDFKMNENNSAKIRKAILWISLCILSSIIGVLISGILKF